MMSTKGLLVENHNGQDFLLTIESCIEMNTHRLIVLKRSNGKWQPLTGTEEQVCRESLMGAFVDCFVDICRGLNFSSPNLVPATTPTSGRSREQRAVMNRTRRG
jgi:hypothetical protein